MATSDPIYPRLRWTGLAAFIICLMVTGCAATRPSTFYLLQPVPDSTRIPTATGWAPFSLGVGPISLPEYLDRPEMVITDAQHTLTVAEFDRWSEPLKNGFSRVLVMNLAADLPGVNVLEYPWVGGYDVRYRVTANVYRFDGRPGDRATLDVQWAVLAGRGERVLYQTRSILFEPVQAPTYQALVAAQSALLGRFGRMIAETLQRLVQDGQ